MTATPFLSNIQKLATTSKICRTCKHFVPNTTVSKTEKDLQIAYGKCALFGEQNLVTGEVIYTSAAICRSYDLYCGREGKLYETK